MVNLQDPHTKKDLRAVLVLPAAPGIDKPRGAAVVVDVKVDH